jgi:RHS repeat-associated protein
VKKVAGGVVTHYIWEGGHVIAEYERGGAGTQATGARYYHRDRLSTRVITDGAGVVVGAMDQLPFGEEIGGSGEREKHKFGSYERDGTGIDYAVNRHYASQQGRFNQVDPLGMGASSLADPQSLNLYSYTQNDPINLNDPTGLYVEAPMFVDDGYGGMGGFKGGFARGGGGATCYIDGIQSSCGMASRLLASGAGVIGPSNTTRWDPELNQGKGGFKHLSVDANGKASWGYWSEVTTRAVDAARNELWSYTDTEWHLTMIGDLTVRNGMLGVDTSGVLRDFNGNIITGGEQPIEMQMLGPLDYIGVGEFKAGLAVGGLLFGGIKKIPSLIGQSFGKLGTVVSNPGLKITSFSGHALDQAITRQVAAPALLNTVRNPAVVLSQANGGRFLFLSNNAAVVVDKAGRVVTTYGANMFKSDVIDILKAAGAK